MRSSVPIPGNPWPHDMVLTITDDDDAILELLWVREAWALQPTGVDLPPRPLQISTPAASAQQLRRHKQEWNRAWSELWFAVLDHLAQARGRPRFDALRDAALGSDERLRLLEQFRGPSWRARFGDEPFNDAYRTWQHALAGQRGTEHDVPLGQQPERQCLDAVIPAWQRGLTTIIPIPCAGTYTRTAGDHALVLTRETRADPARYREALHQFART